MCIYVVHWIIFMVNKHDLRQKQKKEVCHIPINPVDFLHLLSATIGGLLNACFNLSDNKGCLLVRICLIFGNFLEYVTAMTTLLTFSETASFFLISRALSWGILSTFFIDFQQTCYYNPSPLVVPLDKYCVMYCSSACYKFFSVLAPNYMGCYVLYCWGDQMFFVDADESLMFVCRFTV